jgi:hypothetical protein
MPRVFGVQATPSGGWHYVISPLREREANAFMPGLDYQGGMPDGKGRAFVWIAPTVRRSKVEPYGRVAYSWAQRPDMEYLKEFVSDDSVEGIRDRILSAKVKAPGSDRKMDMEWRLFTEEEAQAFCSITLERLEQAEPGEIETAANNAACQLSHFVPELWTEEFAFNVLSAALSKTKYDPEHPASRWTADKFHDVIAGVNGRAPADWEARRKPASVDEVIPELDAVDLLIAEMRKPADIIKQDPPVPLVKGLLNLDSESWIIGEPGSKKSFVATDIAAHVAAGMPWQGLKVHQGGVVMIVAEGGGGLGPRLSAWEMQHGRSMSDRIDILTRPVQAARLEDWAVLREACRRLGPALVVIDTQARVTVGLEENSAKEMGIYVEAVRSIREATGACVLTVHHTGRRGGDARGSSAIDGAQHTELKVEAKDSLSGQLVSEKQKDMALSPDLQLRFVVHTVGVDEDGEPITSLALRGPLSAIERAQGAQVAPTAQEAASAVRVPEPQRWTWELVPTDNAECVVRRQVLQALAHLALDGDGKLWSEIRKSVEERWYADHGATGRKKTGIDSQTWNRVTATLESLTLPGDLEPALVQNGRRFKINRMVLGLDQEGESLPTSG